MVQSRTAHRRNHDGSFDTICTVCFATIARSKNEAALGEYEGNHVCDVSVLAGREVSLLRAPRTGISLVPRPADMALPAVSATGTGKRRWL
jgi:hypothetical protein